jgi:phosphomannomutase/phosphoglucomutase
MILKKIDEHIFREYDVRGIYGQDLTIDDAYTFGRSFASYISDKKVIVGHDNRSSSLDIHKALICGLLEGGVEIIDLGLVTTPMYYFAKKNKNIINGIMITASHNPKEYNGFKFSFSLKGNACGKEIYDFRDYTNSLNYEKCCESGSITYYAVKDEYLNLIKNSINLGEKRIKAVIDCGNGTGSIIIKDILDMFNIDYDLLYCDSDPNFPHHHPDPSVKSNMIDLSKRVVELGYDIGIGIDGDADRVGIVLETGEYISADLVMLIIYRALNKNLKNRKAIYDVKCSRTLIDGLKDLNLDATMNRTGNSYMNLKINEGNYDFGGEFSGHFWFRDKWPGFDDGIYAGLRLIEILSNSDKKISSMLDNIHKYYSTEEIKIHVNDDNKFKIVDKIKDYCDKCSYNYSNIDGIRVEFDNSWGLIRASNTGPDLTVRFEASTLKELDEIKDEFLNIIEEYK